MIIFPNVISTQSTGNNAWVIQSGDGYKILGVDIFDRWGSKVFRTGEVTDPVIWDGSFNGKMLSPGVYGYVITVAYKNGKEEKLKGDITIIR